MRYIFHPEAEKEYSEAAIYYKERGLKVGKGEGWNLLHD